MPSEPRENPFAAPTTSSTAEPDGAAKIQKKPGFAHQAVRFSLYAPVLLGATIWVLKDSLGANHIGTKIFAAISIITIVAAFLLGLIGTVTSVRRLALWSALLGALGTLLNGAIIVGLMGRLR
jgi:hypothetical protein